MATSSTPDVRFVLGADDSKLVAAFKSVQDQAKSATDGVGGQFKKLETVFSSLQAKFTGIFAVVSGAMFKAAVEATAQMTETTMDLARALGVSTNEAAIVKAAMKDIGAAEGEYEAAAKGMIRQLVEQEDKMRAMGLVTRDTAGNLRPLNDLVLDGIQLLGEFKEGTDRAVASKQLFGRGIESSSRLMLYNREVLKENIEAVEELGLTVGAKSVAAWKDFDAAADRAALGMDGMKKAIGDALMPVVTTLLDVLNTAMPAAITVVRGALGGLAAGFLFVREGVRVLWETLHGFIVTFTEPLRAIGTALYKVFSGDFQGGMDELKNIPKVIAGAWGDAFDRMTAGAVRTRTELERIFLPDTASSAKGSGGGPGRGTRNAPVKVKDDKEKAQKDPIEPSYMATYEAALDQQRLAFAKANDLRELGKAGELAYWREVLATYEVGSKDRTAITLKMSHLELDILRAQRKDANAIAAARSEDWKAETLDYIAELEARATFEAQQADITQAQLLQKRLAYNAMRLQAELDFITAKLEIAAKDPDANAVEIEKLELAKLEIRRKYAAQGAEILRAQVAEQQLAARTIAEAVGEAFGKLTQALYGNWRNLGQALRGVLADIGKTIIDEVVTKPLKAKVVAWAKERLITLFGIHADAAKAGSGAAASQAGIPVIGPALALASMAAVMGAVGGLAGKVPSARGGFDIPRGYNPLTQLHEQEMVLPAPLANAVREMAAGAGAGAGGGAELPPVHIHGQRGDFIRLDDLPRVLASLNRRHVFVDQRG